MPLKHGTHNKEVIVAHTTKYKSMDVSFAVSWGKVRIKQLSRLLLYTSQ